MPPNVIVLAQILSIVGMVLMALGLGWLWRHRIPEGTPLSPLAGGRFIGVDYFERLGAVRALAPSSAPIPRGLIDSVLMLEHPDLKGAEVPDEVLAFLERAGDQRLRVRPHWRFGFRTLGWLALRLARAMGQFDIPYVESELDTRVFPVSIAEDPREHVRAIVRTYPDGRPMQVVAYGVHRLDGVGYLNCAFPLPMGNLSGMLRLDALRDVRGLCIGASLTSRPRGAGIEGAGIWYVSKVLGLRVRLPLQETLSLWAAKGTAPKFSRLREEGAAAPPETITLGRHQMWIFGIRFLVSEYFFWPREGASS